MIKPWKILDSKQTFRDQFLGIRTDKCVREDGHIVPTYHVIEQTPWVTIFPLTDEGNIVLIREYRHAAQVILTAVPGGVSDPGETDWEAVGRRELGEETGYEARDMRLIGSCYPNPAVQDNELHFFLALGCTPTAQQSLDPNEEIEVFEVPYQEFLAYEQLDVQHALHAAGLFYLERYFLSHPELRPAAPRGLPSPRRWPTNKELETGSRSCPLSNRPPISSAPFAMTRMMARSVRSIC